MMPLIVYSGAREVMVIIFCRYFYYPSVLYIINSYSFVLFCFLVATVITISAYFHIFFYYLKIQIHCLLRYIPHPPAVTSARHFFTNSSYLASFSKDQVIASLPYASALTFLFLLVLVIMSSFVSSWNFCLFQPFSQTLLDYCKRANN